MKKLLLLVVSIVLLSGCGLFNTYVYDEVTVKNLKVLRGMYITDIERAKQGNLPDAFYNATLEVFDSSIIREKAKKGDK